MQPSEADLPGLGWQPHAEPLLCLQRLPPTRHLPCWVLTPEPDTSPKVDPISTQKSPFLALLMWILLFVNPV